jgi:succinate-semialdehyde dehydrogenase
VSLKDAIPKIVTGRIFDNGIICSSEQTVMVHEDDYANVVEEFKANGALYIDDRRRLDILRKALYPDGVMNKDLVGQSVKKIGELSGLSIPEGTRLILVKADGSGTQDFFCKEKMCPVLAILPYKTFEEAVAIAQENLNVEGRGHSASIHSDDRRHIEYAAERLTVSRVLVNQICATMNGGSYHNGFSPTTTLGCGSWGNNSISENFTYKHLLNISRIGYFMKEAKVPTEQELWG